ncbi:MAG: NCS2 family permease [Erysipelotrichales bacterium]|nr:NCS2 family permease [Erysipelotrichales bacterium]
MFEKLFKLSEKHTDVKTEVMAGLTTFLAMAYILGVNPGMLSAVEGMSFPAVFLATAVSSGIATLIMALLANYPVALAPGMGVNAFFAFTVCLAGDFGGYGYTFSEALFGVFLSGIVFVLVSITGLREAIINAIPKNMKLAIGAGIGFFIAFIGLKNAGIIVANESTAVALGNLADPAVLLALFGIIVTIVLMIKKVNGAVFIGMVINAVIGAVLGMMGFAGMPAITGFMSVDFDFSLLGAFMQGAQGFFSHSSWFIVLFSFLFVDFFDTAGTLVAVGNNIGLVDKDGKMENIDKALLADSVGTVVGAAMGTSTVTSFVESGSGVAAGGRTGLTALVTGVCFFLSVFFYPLISGVAVNAVTAPAIFVVGILMSQQLREVEFEKLEVAAPAFITVVFMILAYSISDGIAMGFITYGAAMLAANRKKEVTPLCWILIVVFILYYVMKFCFA